MQILQRFSHVLRNKLDFSNGRSPSKTRIPPHESTGDLERQIYGMGKHEQSIVRQVLSMPGEALIVRQDTFAIDKNNNPYYLEKGRQIRISENPLTFGQLGDALMNILDEGGKTLSIRLSDFIEDIYTNRQEAAVHGQS